MLLGMRAFRDGLERLSWFRVHGLELLGIQACRD